MRVGVQFSGNVPAGTTKRWFTYGWPPDWHVVWTVVPTTPNAGAPQVEWDVEVQRSSATAITYWISIHNLAAAPIDIEARYEVMN
jgi:hypothetical protein